MEPYQGTTPRRNHLTDDPVPDLPQRSPPGVHRAAALQRLLRSPPLEATKHLGRGRITTATQQAGNSERSARLRAAIRSETREPADPSSPDTHSTRLLPVLSWVNGGSRLVDLRCCLAARWTSVAESSGSMSAATPRASVVRRSAHLGLAGLVSLTGSCQAGWIAVARGDVGAMGSR